MNMKTALLWEVSLHILVERYQSSKGKFVTPAAIKAGFVLPSLNIGLFIVKGALEFYALQNVRF
jgi:hypothetical protein